MNVCMMAPRFPFPTTKGDKLRVFHAIRQIAIADAPGGFAATLVRLVGDPGARARQATAAHGLVEREFTSAANSAKIERMYNAVLQPRADRRPAYGVQRRERPRTSWNASNVMAPRSTTRVMSPLAGKSKSNVRLGMGRRMRNHLAEASERRA